MNKNFKFKVNLSNFAHAFVSSSIFLILILITSILSTITPTIIFLCALPGIFYYAGREMSQYEAKLIKSNTGLNSVGIKSTIESLKIWNWDNDSQWDLYMPILFSTIIGLVILWTF